MSTFFVRQRQTPGAIRDCKRGTLNSLVKEKLDEFERQREDLPALRTQLATLEAEAAAGGSLTKQWEARDLRRRVESIESGEVEMEYLFTVAPVLYAYGEENEFGAEALRAATEMPELPVVAPAAPVISHGKCLGSLNKTYVDLLKKEADIQDRGAGMCPECGVSMYVTPECFVCPDCGTCQDSIDSTFKNCSYKEQRPVSFFAYKRINHFNEWLQRFQGKDHANIPDTVFSRVQDEMRRMRVSPEDLTQQRLRLLLKKIGLNKYYEHIPRIFQQITGKELPQLTPAQEEQLRSMFLAMQEPFARACPSDRKNFLSYSFVLLKLAQLLHLDHILDAFSLLKSKEKLYVQERVWRAICEQLGWQYIRTI